MDFIDGGGLAAADEIETEALTQVPQDVRPDFTVVVGFAEEAGHARPVVVGLAVDPAQAARPRILGEARVAVDRVGKEVAAAFANGARFGAVEGGIQAVADAVMELMQDDIGIEVAVDIERTIAVDVLGPAVAAVPQEHADHRARAFGSWEERGVVAAGGPRHTRNRIAAEATAPEVVDLEVAGGLVETEVVEEVVREVQREEQCRFGRARRIEGEVEHPARSIECAERAFGLGVAAVDVDVVAGQPAGVAKNGRWIPERHDEVAELVVERRRAGGRSDRHLIWPPRVERLSRR